MSDTYLNNDLIIDMKKLLYPALLKYCKEEIIQTLTDVLPEDLLSENEMLLNIINLVPFKGYLMPYENQIINMSLHRVRDMYVRLRALCHVLSGPTEVLDMVGTFSDVSYYIDKTCVDFHRQVIHFVTY